MAEAYIASEPQPDELILGQELRLRRFLQLSNTTVPSSDRRNESVVRVPSASSRRVVDKAAWEVGLTILPLDGDDVGSDRAAPLLAEQVQLWNAAHEPHSRLSVLRLASSNQRRNACFSGQADLVFIGNGEKFGGRLAVCAVELKSSNDLSQAQKEWRARFEGMAGPRSFLVATAKALSEHGLSLILNVMECSTQPLLPLPTSHHAQVDHTVDVNPFDALIEAAFKGVSVEERGVILASMAQNMTRSAA